MPQLMVHRMKYREHFAAAALIGLMGAVQAQAPITQFTGLPQAVQPGPGSVPALTPTPLPPDYVLGPDDQIDVSVLGHADFSAAVTVLPDGTFSYPVLGKVHAAGLTVDKLTAKIAAGLSSQLNQPTVTVYLRQGRARRVSVIGRRPPPSLSRGSGPRPRAPVF